jgi:hypothetical protein
MVELCAREFLAVCVWPVCEPDDPCCRLRDDKASWLDLKAYDQVLLRRKTKAGRTYWVERVVKRVILYRVFSVEFYDREVNSARDWLEGRTDVKPVDK